ncbi:helix-turn-helix protein [Herbihabitans rhizosphaerae]|uniref:Helix-turn-helix protein n=1 Tax=Herbihabitans rhizosphaerae TaxID=1872711 RepID=A0A4Q7KJQ2_9PSEU|nr:helix-turn-helix transcriptional regulator [Herbihabitans rhizosphaerae]RZS36808.1 helix-turn-helix protein [Herbihabitans rhizosphaerae]
MSGDLAESLRAARVAADVSLAALARRTHFSKAALGHIETGRRAVRPEHVVAYAQALGVPVAALYGPPTDPLRRAHEWLVSSPVTEHARAGRYVGDSLVATLERRVVELRRLDDELGGRDLYPLVRNELSDAEALAREASYADATGRRLLAVVGQLSQLAGWVASDAGRHTEAEHVYLSGVHAADAAGDRTLGAQLLSTLSYQLANVGDPRDAALLAQTAVAGAEDAPPIARALLLERVAWASARAGERGAAARALDAVDDAYADRGGDAEPDWVYWLDRREIDVMAGRVFIATGEPERAEPLITSALDGYGGSARERGLYLAWLADGYARAGNLDAARTTLVKARKAADGVGSTRLDRVLADVAPGSSAQPRSGRPASGGY